MASWTSVGTSIVGSALTISARSDDPRVSQSRWATLAARRCDHDRGALHARYGGVPPDQMLYACRYPDWTVSRPRTARRAWPRTRRRPMARAMRCSNRGMSRCRPVCMRSCPTSPTLRPPTSRFSGPASCWTSGATTKALTTATAATCETSRTTVWTTSPSSRTSGSATATTPSCPTTFRRTRSSVGKRL